MSWWLAVPGAIKAGQALYNYANPVKRTQSKGETDYRAELTKRAKHGVFDPSEKREIISDVSRATGQASSQAKQETFGQTSRQGIENSSVVPQLMQNVEEDRMRRIAEASRKIALKNSMAKIEAQNKIGDIGFKDTERNFQMDKDKRQSLMDFVSESTGVVSGFKAGDFDAKTPEAFKMGDIFKDGNPDLGMVKKAMEGMSLEEYTEFENMLEMSYPDIYSELFGDEEEEEDE